MLVSNLCILIQSLHDLKSRFHLLDLGDLLRSRLVAVDSKRTHGLVASDALHKIVELHGLSVFTDVE